MNKVSILICAFVTACSAPPPLPGLLDAGRILDDAAGADSHYDFDAALGDVPPLDAGGQVRIDQVLPNNGVRSGGYRVRISGDGMTPNTRVMFGSQEADNLLLQNERTITLRVPAALQSGPVDLVVDNGATQARMQNAFTYYDDLGIDSLSPTVLSTRGGAQVQVQGQGFVGDLLVMCGDRQAANVQIRDAEHLSFIAPPSSAGRANLEILSSYGRAVLALGLEYQDPLRADRLVPQSTDLSGGQTIVLYGQGFAPTTQLFIDNVQAPVSWMDATRLQFVAPTQSSAGVYQLRVEDLLGQARLSDGLVYVDSAAHSVAISSLQDRIGSPAGGDRIDIFGSQLDQADLQVLFGDQAASIQARPSNTHIVVTTPLHSPGLVDVRVLSNQGDASLPQAFRFAAKPHLYAISPASGSTLGGETIHIQGAGFVSGTQVWLGGQALQNLQWIDANTLSATTPPGSSGLVDLELQGPFGQQAMLNQAFRYHADLQLTALRPVRGGMSGGTYVRLYGSGFLDGAIPEILFGDSPASDVQVISDSLITLRSPAHAPALLNVTVQRPQQQDTLSRAYTFYDPGFLFGGVRGGEIDGAIYVTCYNSMTRMGIPDLSVQLGLHTGAYFALTDANGQATLSGPDLQGPQTITVAGAGYASITLVQVNAKEITVFVNPTSFSSSSGSPPPLPPPPSISGSVSGFAKELFDPAALGPDESALAIVETSVRTVFNSPQAPTATQYVVANGGLYTIPASRPGRLAIVAVAGIFNASDGSFRPRQIGFHRGVSAAYGDQLTDVDIELTVPLNSSLDVTLPNIPLGDPDPESGVVMPFINFGGEGVYALRDLRVQAPSTVTLQDFPDLPGEMITFLAGAFVLDGERPCQQSRSCPYSVVMRHGVGQLRSGITMDPLLGFPQIIEPETNGVMQGGRMRWKAATGTQPSYYQLYLSGLDGTSWDFYIPGALTKFTIPEFADINSDIPPQNAAMGAYQAQFVSVYAPDFDYNNFSYLDLSSSARRSWNQQVFKFVKGEAQP